MKMNNTELFIDYLETNDLPEEFDEITGFKDIFISYYADSEIGFETEILFKMKLQYIASIYIPIYKVKIEKCNTLLSEITEFEHTRKKVYDFSVKDIKRSNLPNTNDIAEVIANSIDIESAHQNVENEYFNDLDLSKIPDLINFLIEVKYDFLHRLVKEFENCFLGVY